MALIMVVLERTDPSARNLRKWEQKTTKDNKKQQLEALIFLRG
jgi:hypothetical protein